MTEKKGDKMRENIILEIDRDKIAKALEKLFEGWMSPWMQFQPKDEIKVEDKAYEFFALNFSSCMFARVHPNDLVKHFLGLIK